MTSFRREIYKIAKLEIAKKTGEKSWMKSLHDVDFGTALYKLSQSQAGPSSDEGILLKFFTPEARTLLLSLPNTYWTWLTVQEVILANYDSQEKISAFEIRSAIAQIRVAETYATDLSLEINNMTHGDIAVRTACGILLVAFEGNQPVALYNPIFSPQGLR